MNKFSYNFFSLQNGFAKIIHCKVIHFHLTKEKLLNRDFKNLIFINEINYIFRIFEALIWNKILIIHEKGEKSLISENGG